MGALLGAVDGLVWFTSGLFGNGLGRVGLRVVTLGFVVFAFGASGRRASAVFERGYD